MPPDERTLKAAEPVIAALESCSVSRAIWHLDATERWKVVRDTLLGHPQIRGDLRPRDLPLDGEFRELLAGIAAFQSRHSRTNKASHRYRFGEWLYSFAVLVEPQLNTDAPGAVPVAHQAVYECFREIRRTLPWPDDTNPDSGEFSKTCPILHRLIAAVGWSIKDWHTIHRVHDTLPVHEAAAEARLAARVVFHSGKVGDLQGKDIGRFEKLSTPTLRLLIAETKSVQAYLCRGLRHWLMRGASAWCAQVLAFIRDEIPNIVKGSLLLSDSDVLASFLVPADTTWDSDKVADALLERWRDGRHFLQRFPRLEEIPEVRERLRDSNLLDPRMAFPSIAITLGKPTSLLELCTPRIRNAEDPNATIGEQTVRPAGRVAVPATAPRCSYVKDDAAIAFAPPAWLETRGDNDGHQVQESYGFTCLVWSLCGTTLKAHWFQNASRRMSEAAPGMRMMPIHHGEWLKWLRAKSEPITFLKLDGDSVGAVFTGTPIPRRPYLSMELGRLVFERVMAATRAVIEQQVHLTNHTCEHLSAAEQREALKHNMPCNGHDIPLAADMVYVGGDDIFFCLPQRSVGTFLAGFSAPVDMVFPEFPNEWRGLRFKFASVTLPSGEEIAAKSDQMQHANLWASRLASDDLKQFVKAGDMSLFEKVRSDVHKEGFVCDIWEPDLTPHAGMIDDSIVHGVHVRLRAV